MFCLSISWIISGILLPLLFIFFYYILKLLEVAPFAIRESIIFSVIGFLFVVIGTAFFIKFFLSIYILVFEGEKGMKVLFKGRELVAGKFWRVSWRILAFIFTIIIIGFLFNLGLTLVGINLAVMNIIIYLFIWLIIPFCLIYGLLIYKNIKENKTEVFNQVFLQKKKIGFIKIGAYVIIGILGLLIGLSFLGVTVNIIYRADDESIPYDQDLWLPRIEIPIQKNAFYVLAPYFIRDPERFLEHWPEQEKYALKVIEFREIYFPREKRELIDNIIEGKKWDQEFVKHFLEKNRQVLDDFQRAAQLPYFQDPMTQNPKNISTDTPVFPVSLFLNIARINAINSAYLFNQGKEEEAFNRAIEIVRVGQMFQDSQGFIISYLVSLTLKETGFRRIKAMISKTTLSPEILKEYIVQLEKFKLNEKGLKNALKIEYILTVNMLKEMFENMPSSFLWKPNQTRRKFAESLRTQIKSVYKFCGDIIEPRLPEWPPSWIKENFIGRTIWEIVIVNIRGLNYRRCEEDFSITITQLLLAMRAYQIETGEIPISLNRLVPKYIFEIPKDPFGGESIRFCPEEKIIWSVGRDLIDEGGSREEHWREMPDPTFEINFK